jgi:hypothetical protein
MDYKSFSCLWNENSSMSCLDGLNYEVDLNEPALLPPKARADQAKSGSVVVACGVLADRAEGEE